LFYTTFLPLEGKNDIQSNLRAGIGIQELLIRALQTGRHRPARPTTLS